MMNYTRGFSKIIVLLMVIVLGAAGYMLYNKKQVKEVPETIRPTEDYQFKSTLSSSEESSWKAYSFKDGDFSIKYPPDWKVINTSFDKNGNPVEGKGYFGEKMTGTSDQCLFQFGSTNPVDHPQNFISHPGSPVISKNISIDGKNAVAYFHYNNLNALVGIDIYGLPTIDHKMAPYNTTPTFEFLFTKIESASLSVNPIPSSNTAACEVIFDKMISSVKYL
jgi:hypothetical protein